MSVDLTRDGFLDNRITALQPRRGFRAGHDSVFLAAAVAARAGDKLLELGSGTGIASLCLAWRVPGCSILGVESDPDLVALANDNARANGMADRIDFVAGDAPRFSPPGERFHHVFLNPPFHPPAGQQSPSMLRDRAMRDSEDALVAWTRHAASLLREDGCVTVILRADRLAELQEACSWRCDALPLAARAGEPPKRVIARLLPGQPPELRTLAPVVLHQADGRPTAAAEAVLRRGEALAFD